MNSQNIDCLPETQTNLDGELFRRIEARLEELLALPLTVREWTWDPIARGGSDRDFYRARHPEGMSWIVMRYSTAREENVLYPGIALFLRENRLNAPRVVFHDGGLRLIVLEDLGDVSLHAFQQQHPGSERLRALYETALDQARRLHGCASAPVRMMNGFDENLYRWERQYFLEHLAHRWAGIQMPDSQRLEIEREGDDQSAELLKIPRCLIHRDFQSQNLMVREGDVWLIDFQGMRLGHAAYDVASLLFDPYVSLAPAWRSSLRAGYALGGEFEQAFYRAAVQRTMQALGAYAFLGLVKQKRAFLQHIPRGLENLREALQNLGKMARTLELVEQIQSEKQDLLETHSQPKG